VFSVLVLVVFRHRTARRNMEQSARTYAALVSKPLATLAGYLGSSGRGILSQQVAALRGLNQDVARLEIVDVRGDIVLRAERDAVSVYTNGADPPTITDSEVLRAVSRLESTAASVTEPDGSHVYRVVAPVVRQWGGHMYSLVATFSYDRVNRQYRLSLWLSALIIVGALALTHRVSVTLASGITRDVERLRAGVQRFQEGNLDERVTVHSRDEIEELAEAFNAMAEELQNTIHRLREANRELETLDQTKADLVANVSHELKTPLTALRGYLELMTDGGLGDLPDEAARAVLVCRKNVQRLSLRVEELVQLSHLERFTSPDATREDVDLRPLLKGIIETFRPRMEDNGLDIFLEIDPDLPLVASNGEQIERVFLNIIDNAIKFTPDGGQVRVVAETHVHEGRDGVLVKVQDSGIGIPRSALVRIFDRFHQVDPSSRRRFGGMGLGLSLVRSIVEAHRGAVWAESEEAIGSTFFVWLPTAGTAHTASSRGGPSDRLEDGGANRQRAEDS